MENEDDILGLDQPIKLGRVSKIAKITDELLFENNRGLPQIRNNYKKLSRAIRKNDQALATRVSSQGISKKRAQQLKITTEVENLEKVLSFYQLWCHGLFPRATFKDCLKMVRDHNNKSVPLKEYRRGLLEAEIRRLKVEKGIIVEEPERENDDADGDLYSAPGNNEISSNVQTETNVAESAEARVSDDDEDDWGFMSTNRRRNNGLFVDDEDELVNEPGDANSTPNVETQSSNHVPADNNSEHDFDDEIEDFFHAEQQKENEPEDLDHDEELAVMREMGL